MVRCGYYAEDKERNIAYADTSASRARVGLPIRDITRVAHELSALAYVL